MLGAIIGDIVGSVYEIDNYRGKDFSPLFHPQARFTDDTVCTIAVADALMNQLDPAEAFKNWGRRYWDNGGWGERFAHWLQSDSTQPYGSFGNGAAMRVSPAGIFGSSIDEVRDYAEKVTAVTHNHPEGLKGAEATALCIFFCRHRFEPDMIKKIIADRTGYDLERKVEQIRESYVFDATCQGSVPEALICAFDADDYEDALRNAVSIGGDSDTIACIAGAVAEARFGIPQDIAERGASYLPDDMKRVLAALYAKTGASLPIRL